MSLILKGIDFDEITKGNGYARLIIEEDGTVVDDISDIIIGEAVQIPKGHGRLIDADKVDYDEFWHREGHGFTIRVCHKAQQIIEEQPTILDKERE